MKKKTNTEENIFEEFEYESSRINKSDINEIVSDEKDIINKTSKLDSGRFKKFINQIKLTLSLIRDFKERRYTDVPWRSMAMIAASILYFVNPFDMVPDILPIFGFTDDALLFASVFKSIQIDLEKYCKWKGFKPENYF